MRLKTGILVAFLAGCLSFSASAQREELPTYTIYAGTFLNATAAEFEGVRTLGFPYAIPISSNMFRIYMGGYSNKADADQVAFTLRSRGFTDASVVQLDPAKGQPVTVIQLGTKRLDQAFSWDEYNQAGPLNVLLENKTIKFTTAAFPDFNSAKSQLDAIRKMGFKDAFIKSINSVFVHEINDFYPEAQYTPPVQTAPAPTDPGIRTVPQEVPQAYNQVSVLQPPSDIPTSYNVPVAPEPAATTAKATRTMPKPAIRSSVKRNSAYELQLVLNQTGFLKSGLDGYYGKGTQAAYDAAFRANALIPRYQASLDQAGNQNTAAPGSLQFAINALGDDPGAALPILTANPVPVSKVYMAYYYFVSEGSSMKVNDLMNSAILEAYAKAVRPARTRMDYTQTYSYSDLGQLITHLAYVQVVSNPPISTPCWLLQRHPKEALSAFNPDPALPKGNYDLPNCGGFMDWPEIQLLLSLSKDMSGSRQANERDLANGRAKVTQYMADPKPLSMPDQTITDTWHTKMINGVKEWDQPDAAPMLKEMGQTFRLLYFQSYVLLEDYYMDQKLSARDAKGLAQATLRGLIGPYMDAFIR